MRRIVGYERKKYKYFGKICKAKKNMEIQEKSTPNEVENIEEKIKVQEIEEAKEITSNEQNCFALVVVRKLPWYKKLVRNIRNFIVIYKWRKAR